MPAGKKGVYATVGGLRFPKRPGTAPGAMPEALFTAESGKVKPVEGSWQLMQACPGGFERLLSRKRLRPRATTSFEYFCFGKVDDEVLTVRFTYRAGVIRIFGAGFWRQGRAIYERENQIHG